MGHAKTLILRKKQTGTIAGLGLIAVDRQVLLKLASVIAQGMAAAVERGICTADKPFAVAIREDLVERAVYHVLDGNALDHGHHGVAVAEDKVDAVARRVGAGESRLFAEKENRELLLSVCRFALVGFLLEWLEGDMGSDLGKNLSRCAELLKNFSLPPSLPPS